MATRVSEHRRNERISRYKAARQAIPKTRAEHEALFGTPTSDAPARSLLLYRANRMGLLEQGLLTQADLQQRVRDAMYDEDGNLRLDV